jgi:hypothetical protein
LWWSDRSRQACSRWRVPRATVLPGPSDWTASVHRPRPLGDCPERDARQFFGASHGGASTHLLSPSVTVWEECAIANGRFQAVATIPRPLPLDAVRDAAARDDGPGVGICEADRGVGADGMVSGLAALATGAVSTGLVGYTAAGRGRAASRPRCGNRDGLMTALSDIGDGRRTRVDTHENGAETVFPRSAQ